MVPTVRLPLGIEFTSHVKAGLLAFSTSALNCTVPPVATSVAGAETVTVAAGGAGAGGSPAPVAAPGIKPSGASNIRAKHRARLQPAGGRWCSTREAATQQSKAIGKASQADPLKM